MKLVHKLLWSVMLCTVCLSCNRLTERKDGYAVHGIDVSRYQNEISWQEVDTSQIQFAFVKATEGKEHVDRLFHDNWAALRATGIKRGAYHFFRPSISAQAQFTNYSSQVVLTEGDLPPVLDFESVGDLDKAQLKNRLQELLQLLHQHYKIKPIIYTNLELYKAYIANTFDQYPIWIARYSDKTPMLNYGDSWTFWQYGNRGQVSGIEGDVDLNVFHGSQEELESLCVLSKQIDMVEY